MRTFPLILCATLVLALAGSAARPSAQSADEKYLFVDASKRSTWTGHINFSKLRDRLAEAGAKGYAIRQVDRFALPNLLFERDDRGPRTYRLIAHGRERSFLQELNAAGAEGFAVVSDMIRAVDEAVGGGVDTTWVAVMEPRTDGARSKYSVVKGTEEGQRALAGSGAAGRVLKATLGRMGAVAANTLLFLEESDQQGNAC